MLLIFIVTNVTICQSATMRIVKASLGESYQIYGRELSGNVTCCPTAQFQQFTIECVPDSSTSASIVSASFYLNGTLYHREFVRPFTIRGQMRPWDPYPRKPAVITCVLSDGDETSARVIFKCPVAVSLSLDTLVSSPSPCMTPEPDAAAVYGTEVGKPPDMSDGVRPSGPSNALNAVIVSESPDAADSTEVIAPHVWPLDIYIDI